MWSGTLGAPESDENSSLVVLLYQFHVTTRTAEWLFSRGDSFILSQVVLLYKFSVTMMTAAFLQYEFLHALSSVTSLLISCHNEDR